MRIMFYTLA
ncbi:hypothetical protein CFP56_035624 [Quercus suber]|uniref:Uncharacterized protein n=1 Tax=Quercus suber TaxID=58331 RepID=A0AAW0J9B4_QUESU